MEDSSASSSAGPAISSLLTLPITENLSENNLVLWKSQVLPAIRGAQLEGHLDGTAPVLAKEIDVTVVEKTIKSANPEYTKWVAHGQQVLGYLLTTMTRDVMVQVATTTTAAELWSAEDNIYLSQTRA
ncbi:uncharacterized protein LOC105915193 [Setaria italica]|uniref:uncharacterized protein LOC105915193 n=1 Tax=Setaria italica TaxID=4555 RepID=UPI0006461A7E|nr:uncharacterized protein LOC105915193 [Setaria italica]